MGSSSSKSTPAEQRRDLTKQIAAIGHKIEKEPMGTPKRLRFLREQAGLSDRREALSR